MGAVYISNRNVSYRSAKVKPQRILIPMSRLPRNSAKASSFRASFPSECTTTKISLLMSSFLLFPRFDKALGGAQEGRGFDG